jgi:hypothetical protein
MLDKYTKNKPYLLHTFTGKYDQFGFKCFLLEFVNNGKAVDRLHVISGSPTAQRRQLPHPKEDYSKSGNPLPEGIYKVGEIIQMCAPEKGVGCIKIPLDVLSDFRVNNRSEFLIHEDFNAKMGAIGSLGCIVTYTKMDMDRIVSWCSQKARPQVLVADYGQGLLKAKKVEVEVA